MKMSRLALILFGILLARAASADPEIWGTYGTYWDNGTIYIAGDGFTSPSVDVAWLGAWIEASSSGTSAAVGNFENIYGSRPNNKVTTADKWSGSKSIVLQTDTDGDYTAAWGWVDPDTGGFGTDPVFFSTWYRFIPNADLTGGETPQLKAFAFGKHDTQVSGCGGTFMGNSSHVTYISTYFSDAGMQPTLLPGWQFGSYLPHSSPSGTCDTWPCSDPGSGGESCPYPFFIPGCNASTVGYSIESGGSLCDVLNVCRGCDDNGSTTSDYRPYFPDTWQWNRVDIMLQRSSVDGSDGKLKMTVWKPSGSYAGMNVGIDVTGLAFNPDQGADTCFRCEDDDWDFAGFYGYFDDQDDPNRQRADFYFDDVYVQKGSVARVEIGDASVYENCTEVNIQYATARTDSSITVAQFNRGRWGIEEDVYLFVIDSNGVASAGYPITVDTDAVSQPSPWPPDDPNQ